MDPLLVRKIQTIEKSSLNVNNLWLDGAGENDVDSMIYIALNENLVQSFHISGEPWFRTERTEEGSLETICGINYARILPGETRTGEKYLVKNVSVTLRPHFTDIQNELNAKTLSTSPGPIGYVNTQVFETGPYLHLSFEPKTGEIKWKIDTDKSIIDWWIGLNAVDFRAHIKHDEARLESIDFLIEQDLYYSGSWLRKLFCIPWKNRKLRHSLKVAASDSNDLIGLDHPIVHKFSIKDKEFPIQVESVPRSNSRVIMVSQLAPR
jgi:hypothetical protein